MKALGAFLAMAVAGAALWVWVVVSADIDGWHLAALIAGEVLAVTAYRPLEKKLRKGK